jgi:hypothetical protein
MEIARIKNGLISLDDLYAHLQGRQLAPKEWMATEEVQTVISHMEWDGSVLPSNRIYKQGIHCMVCKELAVMYACVDIMVAWRVVELYDSLVEVLFKRKELDYKWAARAARVEVSLEYFIDLAQDVAGVSISESMVMVGMTFPEWLVMNKKFQEVDVLEDLLLISEVKGEERALAYIGVDIRLPKLHKAIEEYTAECLSHH